MKTAHRLTLSTQLLIGFIGIGMLVISLVLAGDRALRADAVRLESALTAQVRPLARLNRLQSQISRIRVLEVGLPRLTDLFAVSDQIELLSAERGDFERELSALVTNLSADDPKQAAALRESWHLYQSDLQRFGQYAGQMNLAAAQQVSTYDSDGRFKTLSRLLKALADSTELRANEAFVHVQAQHAHQRMLFIASSTVGLGLLALAIGLLARSLVGRVSRLRDAAAQVAEGRGEQTIEVTGNDELSDLGAAFNTMHEQVIAREAALRAAHDELESRVAERTRELNDANLRLQGEIEMRRGMEEKLHQQAEYDGLTGLPNRVLAMDRLKQALLQARRSETLAVLVFVDLDDFKKVNDTLGHAVGDILLVQAAHRLRQAVRAGDTVARLGGDEFVVILGDLKSAEDARPIAEKIVQAFAPSFDIGQSELVVTPSMGLAVYPTDASDASMLLRNADLAMYEAKDAGRNTYRYFNQQALDSSVHKLSIEHQLRGALARGELRLLYQPLVQTTTQNVVGAEALLRWHSPDAGLVLPADFIGVAENTGLIVEIGEWVLQAACAQLRAWHVGGWPTLHIAVNVSTRQFRGNRLLASVRHCLSEHALPRGSLQIEVTESLLIRNQPEVRKTLDALSALGVRLAMDDFGTGYSSLSYLKRYPFDVLKIDREFIRDVANDPDDRALVTAAIRMGKGLGLTVVAEGVETMAQLELLRQQDCDLLQGYLYSEPLDAATFEARWLHRASANHVVIPPR